MAYGSLHDNIGAIAHGLGSPRGGFVKLEAVQIDHAQPGLLQRIDVRPLVLCASGTQKVQDRIGIRRRWLQNAFRNGKVANSAEQNQGSCRVLAFALMQNLSAAQALKCFGEHCRDVLATPGKDNHHNLRRVQAEGLGDIHFEQPPLRRK